MEECEVPGRVRYFNLKKIRPEPNKLQPEPEILNSEQEAKGNVSIF